MPCGVPVVSVFRDGANAYRAARDYKKEQFNLSPERKLTVTLAPGGGFAAIIGK